MLHCVALCCTVLHCVALWCTVVHCGALWCTVVHCCALWCTIGGWYTLVRCSALSCTFAVLHCVALFSTVLHCVALCCTVVYCFAMCCIVLQGVVLRSNALQFFAMRCNSLVLNINPRAVEFVCDVATQCNTLLHCSTMCCTVLQPRYQSMCCGVCVHLFHMWSH